MLLRAVQLNQSWNWNRCNEREYQEFAEYKEYKEFEEFEEFEEMRADWSGAPPVARIFDAHRFAILELLVLLGLLELLFAIFCHYA